MSSVPGHVYWFTGLSGAGKTTLCRRFVEQKRATGSSIVMLDGDELREAFGAMGTDATSRRALAMKYARLCGLLAHQGFDVAIATMSLFSEVHTWNRQHLPGYIEIFLKVPYTELRRRDSKQIYSRAERGELTNVAGIDLPVDPPESPHVVIDYFEGQGVDEAVADLFRQLKAITV